MLDRDVVLWAVDDEIYDGVAYGRYETWHKRDRVTDVVYRRRRLQVGSILVGIRPDSDILYAKVVMVGVVRRVQENATGKDRVTIGQPMGFDPIPLYGLVSDLSGTLREWLARKDSLPQPLAPVKLPAQLAEVLLEAMAGKIQKLKAWLNSLKIATATVSGENGQRLRESRDAVSLAGDFSTVPVPDNPYEADKGVVADAPFGARFDSSYVVKYEDDIIAEDLRRFMPDVTQSMEGLGAARFVADGVALTVVSVNKKPLERVLGVDLLYYDEIEDSFVLVQYKRMGHSGDYWAYKDKARIERHLNRMDLGHHLPAGSQDWRLNPSPFWFKFVNPNDFVSEELMVIKGMYVPAEYLRLALADGSLQTGPGRGFEVTWTNTRHLTRETFVELVRRGFVGTTRGARERVMSIVAENAELNQVIFAHKSRLERGRAGR